jgi:hypothetical protein
MDAIILRNIFTVIIITMIAPRSSSALSIVLLALCGGMAVANTSYNFEGTGSVEISCPEADDVCTPNGEIGGVIGNFNINGGSFKSREGGATAIFTEGTVLNLGGFDSQATMMTCSDGCTCVLSDGETACSVGSVVHDDDDDDSSAFSMNQAPIFMRVVVGAFLMAQF